MRLMWSVLGVIVVTLAVAYLILGALLYFHQASFVYFPSREYVATPEQFGLAYEPVTFRTTDDVLISGWYLPAKKSRGVVLFFHGNAGNISHRMFSLQISNQLGLSTLIFDYRGYGKSGGSTDESGTYRDAEAAWHYLESRGVDPGRILFFGRSLGAAIASYLATRHEPRALIIESAFTSVPDLAARFYPFMPVRWLARLRYDTRSHLLVVRCPVLIIHSRMDEIVPFGHARLLFEVAHQPKEFLEISGGHNDGFFVTGQRYVNALDRFLVDVAGLRRR
jgi:fermentation-respiration switch protein FrsA (DUF1100 family)